MQVPFGDLENINIHAWRYEGQEKEKPGNQGAALQQWYFVPPAESAWREGVAAAALPRIRVWMASSVSSSWSANLDILGLKYGWL